MSRHVRPFEDVRRQLVSRLIRITYSTNISRHPTGKILPLSMEDGACHMTISCIDCRSYLSTLNQPYPKLALFDPTLFTVAVYFEVWILKNSCHNISVKRGKLRQHCDVATRIDIL